MRFGALQYKKDIKIIECAQRKAKKVVKGREGKMYEEQLRSHSLYSQEKRRLMGELLAVYRFLLRGSRGEDVDDQT